MASALVSNRKTALASSPPPQTIMAIGSKRRPRSASEAMASREAMPDPAITDSNAAASPGLRSIDSNSGTACTITPKLA